jgi:hypothetical protein
MFKIVVFLSAVLVLATLWVSSEALALSPDDTRFKGDFRLRYQYDKTDDNASEMKDGRHRERIRLRFGLETDVNERLTVGMRLASGSDDPRSTNQSLGDFFSTEGFHLDLAYFTWKPVDWIAFKGGKFGKAFYTADDLLWDSDITFEGQVVGLDLSRTEHTSLFLNAGMFLLDELKAEGTDPHMFLLQPGLTARPGEGLEVVAAVAYYGFAHTGCVVTEYSAGSNTREGEPGAMEEPGLECDYDSVNPVLGVKRTWDTRGGATYSAGLFGDLVYNPDSEDTGYLVGFKGGHASVMGTGTWQFYYNWRRLEADAFLDIFPDSDFYGGATNASGHEFVLNIGLGKSAMLGLDYYRAEKIEGDECACNLLQVDFLAKY